MRTRQKSFCFHLMAQSRTAVSTFFSLAPLEKEVVTNLEVKIDSSIKHIWQIPQRESSYEIWCSFHNLHNYFYYSLGQLEKFLLLLQEEKGSQSVVSEDKENLLTQINTLHNNLRYIHLSIAWHVFYTQELKRLSAICQRIQHYNFFI